MSATIQPSTTDLTSFDIAGGEAIYGAENNQVDLDVSTALQLSSGAVAQGTSVTINYEVKNLGGTSAGASTAGVYLSTDNVITTSDTLLTTDALAAINAGGALNESVAIATGGIAPGSYFLGIIPDYNNTVVESNEANNPSEAISFAVTSAITSLTTEQQGEIIKLYLAYFNRAPESNGLTFHFDSVLTDLNAGISFESALTKRADQFFEAAIAAPQFSGYSASQPISDFVSTIYSNVLLRPGAGGDAPSTTDIQYWADRVTSNEITRGQVVTEFLKAITNLKSNGTPTEQAIANQVEQVLQNRLTVAVEFAKAENSGTLSGEAAFNAGKAILANVDGTQASVDAALATLSTSTTTNTVILAVNTSHDVHEVDVIGVNLADQADTSQFA